MLREGDTHRGETIAEGALACPACKMSVKAHVIVILMGGVISSLPVDENGGPCQLCPAGTYMLQCNNCSECPEDFFTSKMNREIKCHPCFMDCMSELHMQVVKACTSVSDVVCDCMAGFECRDIDDVSGHCKTCELNNLLTTSNSTTPSPSTKPEFQSPQVNRPSSTEKLKSELWVLTVVLLAILLTCIITLLFCRRRKKECLKQLVKRCSLGKQKEDPNTTSSDINNKNRKTHRAEINSHTFIRGNSDCSTNQPPSTEQPLPPAGSLGPLHIYGAGTVFVSLLNQFGLSGGEKEEEDVTLDGKKKHCPTSPPLPLSKEERSRDESYVSFPFQEQGKECHVSKEEGL